MDDIDQVIDEEFQDHLSDGSDFQISNTEIHDASSNSDLNEEDVSAIHAFNSRISRSSGASSLKKRKKSSWIWDHFDRNEEKCISTCLQCIQADARKPAQYPFSTGNSTLATHLKKSHKISKQGGVSGDPTQTTINTCTGGLQHHFMMDEKTQDSINQSLIQFVVDNKQSFSIVESSSFKTFVNRLNRWFRVPSRRTLCRGLADQYMEALRKFKSILEEIPGRVALTADGWSSRIMRGYFVITVHWIDKKWVLRHSVLEFKYFPPPHNQFSTAQLMMSILKEFSLETRVRSITTDSGSEMAPAMEQVRLWLNDDRSMGLEASWHVRCICHIINRCVVDAQNTVQSEVTKIRSMLKAIRISSARRKKYGDIQILLGYQTKKEVPNLDVETRWNSMFKMIDDCYDMRQVFTALCACDDFPDLKALTLSDFDWRVVKSVKDFLDVLHELTVEASGTKYSTISLQPAMYDCIESHCLSTISGQTSSGFTTSKSQLAAKNVLKKLEKYKDNMWSDLCCLAQILDPRTGNSTPAALKEKEGIRNTLILAYGLPVNSIGNNVRVTSRRSRLFATVNSVRNAGTLKSADTNMDEVDSFYEFTSQPDELCENVIEWWATIGVHRFPTLSLLARDTLMVMGSSVPSESAFSDSGGFVRADRSRLSDENIEMMMKLRSWNRLMENLGPK